MPSMAFLPARHARRDWRAPASARDIIALTVSVGWPISWRLERVQYSAAMAVRSPKRLRGHARTARWQDLIFRTGRCSLVNGAVWPKGVECKCEGDVVRNVVQLSALLPLHDDVANVAATCDGPLVERRGLSGLPSENDIAGFDRATLPQQWQRPRFVVFRPGFDGDDTFHWINAVGQRAVIEERLLP